ncbi:hypothetical protein KAR91_57450 [Candidatus Pacearchaeota archaeon]|nr:hypothetical protein [Candidatus Pacearchaeota archaeon]
MKNRDYDYTGFQVVSVIVLIAIILLAIASSGCQRTDYWLQDDILYISNTSWCTDSSSKKIVIDPNGLVTVTGYGKQEDSIDAEFDPLTKKGKFSTSPKASKDMIFLDGEWLEVSDLELVE